jgi:hypothetical protein
MTHTEKDPRLDLLNTLLTTPHRQLDKVHPIHADMVQTDPLFYVRLAAWYFDHGEVRDHKEMFVVTLALSGFEGHRDVGLALLRQLPPYEVARVVDFIHGTHRKRKTGSDGAATAEKFGLFRNPPRSLRTEVARYLREREADIDWFDSTALVARKALKRLYALFHVAPGERAQKVLFDEQPPTDSRAFALKVLARAASPQEQARAIAEHAIPYRVAATVVREMTPDVLAALIERMSPQEVINNLAALKKRGALEVAELKVKIDAKLESAKTGSRVSALKTAEAVKAAGATGELRQKLEAVADRQVKAKGRIERPTALLIDKSGSMSVAIELGKRIGALLSAVCSRELYVFVFDTKEHRVEAAGDDLAGWEKALSGVTAGGGTSCGVALEAMRKAKLYVEQIVMITDEGENTDPRFVPALQKYRAEVKADPSVCIAKVPGATAQLEGDCRKAGLGADAFQFEGDYYSLPNLVPLLSRPSKLDLLQEIVEYPLPARRS